MTTYTDLPITIRVTGYDMTAADNIHVTFRQGAVVVVVTEVTVDSSTQISLTLDQWQTGRFKGDKPIEVNLNFFDADGLRKASKTATIAVNSNLLERIINHG